MDAFPRAKGFQLGISLCLAAGYWSVREHSMSCTSCGWSALTKQAVRRDLIAQAVMSWRLMTWESVQAGNRASKTRRCLQWGDSRPEWHAMTSAVCNSHNSARLCFAKASTNAGPHPGRHKSLGTAGMRFRELNIFSWGFPCALRLGTGV